MVSDVFQEWVTQLNNEMQIQNRNILLLLDNCAVHPHVQNLSNVSMMFLPPNTTSVLQPMDAGVIRNLKHHYRKSLALRQLLAIESGKEFQFNLHQCIQTLDIS